jgi:GH15 family glucan-1,4-alpha-glucosidase
MYNYGLIGNCQASALIHTSGSLDWLCLPRPDSPPVFGRLLDPDGGHFSFETDGGATCRQVYLPNTNVLMTFVRGKDGAEFKITDFCPRFQQHGRVYRPMSIFRIVEPITESAQIRVVCRPVVGWEKEVAKPVRGNSHVRYDIRGGSLRLTTNMPLTYLCEETSTALKEPLYFALSWDIGIEDDLIKVSHSFLDQTVDYWNHWVKDCSIPSLYQKETIRSALTLKLHCYEDTGAILAALTTSLPEESGNTRNWDYRFCWLRDAYFVLSAFYNLGHFDEMEGFLKFILNIAEKHEPSEAGLRPVYRLDQTLPLPELEHSNWRGFDGSVPVRSGNQAAEHIQNDVYGEMVLTLAPIFFDERLHRLRTKEHERLLAHLGRLCASHISKPDAGLWEVRNGWQEHSFSNLMCWAGLERIERIKEKGFLKTLDFDLASAKQKAEAAIRAAAKDGVLGNGPKDDSFDSALLLLSVLRFPDDKLAQQTMTRIHTELRLGTDDLSSSFLYRYLRKDDFGHPQSAFLICSFWLVQALARAGQLEEARRVFKNAMAASNSLGLFSEHFLPAGSGQTGNFPQAYSHVGLINAAFAVSPPWSEVL